MRLSTMKGIAVGSLMGMTLGAGTDDDASRQTDETCTEQKWFPSSSAGRRLLDEITPCGRRIIGKAPTPRLLRGESVMRRPFLRRLIQAIVILILIFYAFQKRGNAGADRVGFRRCICADARCAFARLHPAGTKEGFRPAVGLRRLHTGACSAGCSGASPLFRTSSRARQT